MRVGEVIPSATNDHFNRKKVFPMKAMIKKTIFHREKRSKIRKRGSATLLLHIKVA